LKKLQQTLGFHKLLAISRRAEDVLASQGVLHGVFHTEQKEMKETDIKYARAGSIYFRDRPLEKC
jgi:hypothetical protein